ncbi:MAG: glycosyltransferase family 2 protein [Bacilli bacterium]
MNDLITIIVNAYNEEKHIKKCVDSILNQTYKNIEILIINDGSTDNTLNIIKKYKDKRIRVISTENKGLSLSRNVGLDNSNGKYIYFLDADDFIEKDTIEYLYNLIKKNKSDMSTCKSLDIYNYDTKIINKEEKINILSNIDMLKKLLLREDNTVNIWNKLIKKELFKNIRFPNRIIEDVPVVYKLILNSKKIVYSNQIKYNRLKHNDSIMGKRKPELLIDIYKATLERYEDIKNTYPNLIENEISILLLIMNTTATNNKIANNNIGIKNMKKLYKKTFKIKMLKNNIGLENKIKIILFRISPSLYKHIFKIYMKLKRSIIMQK